MRVLVLGAGFGGLEVTSAIAEQPGVRAPDLAAGYGMETHAFKLRVRRLKELGLTESLRIGYRLSPRGEALRCLLYMFERGEAIPLMGAG